MVSRSFGYSIARPSGASRRISEALRREGRGSVVAIPRFLCGSLRLCRLRTDRFGTDGKI
jgi:hypothetical protein